MSKQEKETHEILMKAQRKKILRLEEEYAEACDTQDEESEGCHQCTRGSLDGDHHRNCQQAFEEKERIWEELSKAKKELDDGDSSD